MGTAVLIISRRFSVGLGCSVLQTNPYSLKFNVWRQLRHGAGFHVSCTSISWTAVKMPTAHYSPSYSSLMAARTGALLISARPLKKFYITTHARQRSWCCYTTRLLYRFRRIDRFDAQILFLLTCLAILQRVVLVFFSLSTDSEVHAFEALVHNCYIRTFFMN